MPKIDTEITFVGRLDIGRGNIASQLETDQDIEQFIGDVEACVVTVDPAHDRMAVCGDERIAVGTMADIQAGLDPNGETKRKPPVTHKMFGGLKVATVMACVAADWSGFEDKQPKDVMEAYSFVSEALEELGFVDGKHTAVGNIESETATGCGANDGAVKGQANTVEEGRLEMHHQVDAALRGTTFDALPFNDQEYVQKADERIKSLLDSGFFTVWDAVATRRMTEEKNAACVEVLQDAQDATHGHYGDGLVIVDDEALAIDRDALYERRNGRGAFVVSRGFMRTVARALAGTPQEEASLMHGYDRFTAGIGDTLLARGFPVFVVSKK